MLNHLNITVYGDVQGVFFRRTIKHEAGRKRISGFVRNEPDGSVYMEVEGDEEVLQGFTEWLKLGADGHQIKRVDIEKGQFKAFDSFEIS